MTSERIIEVIELYRQKLETLDQSNEQIAYLSNMLTRFPSVAKHQDKAMRWLCFMQGVFWSNGIYSIEELKKHNKSSEEG
jgi:hypothetical protein